MTSRSEMVRLAVIAGRWFRLTANAQRFDVHEGDRHVGLFSSLTAAACAVRLLVGRKGRVSGPLFWGIGTDDCPRCPLSYGAFHPGITWQNGREMIGSKPIPQRGQMRMPNRRLKNVRQEMVRLKRQLWDEHVSHCEHYAEAAEWLLGGDE